MENTNFDGGEVVSTANTATVCLQACFNNASCTGVDWNPVALEGQRCFMIGLWSGQINNRTAVGVTHYDLNRNCSLLPSGSCKQHSKLFAPVLSPVSSPAASDKCVFFDLFTATEKIHSFICSKTRSVQGRIQEFAKGGRSLHFSSFSLPLFFFSLPLLPLPLRSRVP